MESAYLKDAVGMALSKAMAQTIAAQPSNPQEYLALHLLHTLQKRQFQKNQIAQKRRCAAFHQQWLQKQRIKQQKAKKVLQRACYQFKDSLNKRKAQQQQLQQLFDQSRADVDAILSQISIQVSDEESSEKMDDDEIDKTRNKVHEKKRLCNKARAMFCRAQCVMSTIQKHHLKQLKTLLANFTEHIHIAQNRTQSIIDETMLKWKVECEQKTIVDRQRIATARNASANNANSTMVMVMKQQWQNACTNITTKDFSISCKNKSNSSCCASEIHYIVYQVLRCLCYLLLDATPKATHTPEKICQLIKPAVTVKLLRAFNPVATYDMNKCISIYDLLPDDVRPDKENKDNADDIDNEIGNDHSVKNSRRDGSNNNAYNKQAGKVQNKYLSRSNATLRQQRENEVQEDNLIEPRLIPQPKTRQVRRVRRILRVLQSCCTYYPNIQLTKILKHYSSTQDDDDSNDGDNDDNDDYYNYDENDDDDKNVKLQNVNSLTDHYSDLYEIEDKDLAREVADIKFLISCSAQTQKNVYKLAKNKGGLILWALLRFVYTAVQYRVARDAWLDACRKANVELPNSQELPEEQQADPFNEDVLYKQDAEVQGQIDQVAVARLLAKIGTDSDETLAKLWEKKDEQVKKSLHQKLSAYFHQSNKINENEDDDDNDSNDNDDDDDNKNDNNYSNNNQIDKDKQLNQRSNTNIV